MSGVIPVSNDLIRNTRQPKLLSTPDRLLTITTVALSSIALVLGVLVTLQIHNVVNLGAMSTLSAIGANAAYITTGIAVGVILLNFVKLAIQQAILVKRLRNNVTESGSELDRLQAILERRDEMIRLGKENFKRLEVVFLARIVKERV